MMTTLVWFRNDLRLEDNPALTAALRTGAIIPVYIQARGKNALFEGGASRWWRHHSLLALDNNLRARGSHLIIRQGEALTVLQTLIKDTGATAVFWNRRMAPAARAQDAAIKATLKASGIEVQSFNGNYLHEPWMILNKQNKPFQVFTPYWKAVIAAGLDLPTQPAPEHLPAVDAGLASAPIETLGLLPGQPWAAGFSEWQPGEAGAWARFTDFSPKVDAYAEARNWLDGSGVSQLGAHLHFGEITPRQIIQSLRTTHGSVLEPRGVEHFVRELGWREFGAYLAYHFPHTVDAPLDERFNAFAWRDTQTEAAADLRAWQTGQTGIPVVDAAMRCLWQTGWMHNRARMIVASLLTKNLAIDWREGAAWFMDTLIDADEPSNTAGWQLTACTGADAAPYFRIFNPILQAEKFDPKGDFIRRWLPELARLPNPALFAPWTADAATLGRAGVLLGQNYPRPIVDLKISREQALARFSQIKTFTASSLLD